MESKYYHARTGDKNTESIFRVAFRLRSFPFKDAEIGHLRGQLTPGPDFLLTKSSAERIFYFWWTSSKIMIVAWPETYIPDHRFYVSVWMSEITQKTFSNIKISYITAADRIRHSFFALDFRKFKSLFSNQHIAFMYLTVGIGSKFAPKTFLFSSDLHLLNEQRRKKKCPNYYAFAGLRLTNRKKF